MILTRHIFLKLTGKYRFTTMDQLMLPPLVKVFKKWVFCPKLCRRTYELQLDHIKQRSFLRSEGSAAAVACRISMSRGENSIFIIVVRSFPSHFHAGQNSPDRGNCEFRGYLIYTSCQHLYMYYNMTLVEYTFIPSPHGGFQKCILSDRKENRCCCCDQDDYDA